jgi:hypothetical protein
MRVTTVEGMALLGLRESCGQNGLVSQMRDIWLKNWGESINGLSHFVGKSKASIRHFHTVLQRLFLS